MTEFLSFFVVLGAAVFFSALFNRLHLPWVVALLVGGMAIGPQVLNLYTPDDTMKFLSEIGLMFLMFMAGLETRVERVSKHWKAVLVLALANGFIPFAIGLVVALAIGFEVMSAVLLGIIFMSTSIAVVVPSFEVNGIFQTRLGSVTIAATILEDIASLLLLSFVLQYSNPVTAIPLWLYYPLVIGLVAGLRWLVPRVRDFYGLVRRKEGLFQHELRFTFLMLLGVVLMFQLLGLHTIIAGFFAGLIMADMIRSRVLKGKLRAVSYGIFIPVFFIIMGAQTDILAPLTGQTSIIIMVAIVTASMASKFASGTLAGRAIGFSPAQSSLIGVATIPQLTTTLAVAFAAREFGLLDDGTVTAIVVLSIVTTLISPTLINLLARRAAQVTPVQKVALAPLE